MSRSLQEIWDALIASGAHEQTLQVVTSINGYSEETLMDVAYALFGIRDVEDLLNSFVS